MPIKPWWRLPSLKLTCHDARAGAQEPIGFLASSQSAPCRCCRCWWIRASLGLQTCMTLLVHPTIMPCTCSSSITNTATVRCKGRDQTFVNSKRHNEMIGVSPINPSHRSYKPSLPSWGESIVPLIDHDLKPKKNMVYHHYHPRKKTLVPKRIPKVVWVKPAGRLSAMFPQEISKCPTFLYLFGDKSISYTLW